MSLEIGHFAMLPWTGQCLEKDYLEWDFSRDLKRQSARDTLSNAVQNVHAYAHTHARTHKVN